jgi:hypothetical protein
MYNLGNTCFQSAVLQCLIHCSPLQKYFLYDCGHSHTSCMLYRNSKGPKTDKPATTPAAKRKRGSVCLACELDSCMLKYLSSSLGMDIPMALTLAMKRDTHDTAPPHNFWIKQGEPLVTADMLTAAWKCGGLDHLAGYEQKDAHEFLHGFLEYLGKHILLYRERVTEAASLASSAKFDAIVRNPEDDGTYKCCCILFVGVQSCY